jgi:hypothetical protein
LIKVLDILSKAVLQGVKGWQATKGTRKLGYRARFILAAGRGRSIFIEFLLKNNLINMQKKVLLVAMLLLTAFVGHSQGTYKMKSGKIVINFSTGFGKGTKTIIFTDSGRIEKDSAVTYFDTAAMSKIFGKLNPDLRPVGHTLNIHTRDSVFSIDLDSMKGGKRAKFTIANLSPDSIFNTEKKIVGQDTFLNRKCDIISFGGMRIWYWKGFAIKKEMSFPNEVHENAILIDENYVIKEDEFKIPDGVKMYNSW